jgi:hypothetical protein
MNEISAWTVPIALQELEHNASTQCDPLPVQQCTASLQAMQHRSSIATEQAPVLATSCIRSKTEQETAQ